MEIKSSPTSPEAQSAMLIEAVKSGALDAISALAAIGYDLGSASAVPAATSSAYAPWEPRLPAVAPTQSAASVAVSHGFSEALRALGAAGARFGESIGQGSTPLHQAASMRDSSCLEAMLESKPEVDARDGGGRAPLHLSCLHGSLDSVRALVAAGADVDARGGEGATPLMLACQGDEAQPLAKALLDGGADVEARDARGLSALDYACRGNRPKAAAALLDAGIRFGEKSELSAVCALSGSMPKLAMLLLKRGAAPDPAAEACPEGSPLGLAIGRGWMAVCAQIASQGVDFVGPDGSPRPDVAEGLAKLARRRCAGQAETLAYVASRVEFEQLHQATRTPSKAKRKAAL